MTAKLGEEIGFSHCFENPEEDIVPAEPIICAISIDKLGIPACKQMVGIRQPTASCIIETPKPPESPSEMRETLWPTW